jgi:hypothetical protein
VRLNTATSPIATIREHFGSEAAFERGFWVGFAILHPLGCMILATERARKREVVDLQPPEILSPDVILYSPKR